MVVLVFNIAAIVNKLIQSDKEDGIEKEGGDDDNFKMGEVENEKWNILRKKILKIYNQIKLILKIFLKNVQN